MENPRTLLARRLPTLTQLGGTTEPSVSRERLCASYMRVWPDFQQQALEACSSITFTGDVSVTDSPEGDLYFVGSELGLTTRFARHVCDAVSKALSVSNLPLQFGDMQAIRQNPLIIPGVTLAILGSNPARLIAAGVLKTWWTVDLEEITVTSDLDVRRYLEPFIGQAVAYMRRFKLRYSFLSTYKSTVFIKREDDFCFRLSMPISEDATNPSLRECFVGFAAIAAQDPVYEEDTRIDTRLLHSSRQPGFVSSPRASAYRSRLGDSTDSPILPITTESMLIGSDGVASHIVNCVELLSSPRLGHQKAVFEVESGGVRYIAKCWSHDRRESASNEFEVYERLHELRPSGFERFTRLVFSGDIICSAQFPEGKILLLEKVPGEQLFGIWNSLPVAEKAHVFNECSSAIQTLRSISIRLLDSGRHNILYDRMSGKVTLVDFEAIDDLGGVRVTSLNPELVSIFGVTGMSQFIHSG
ncbi:hypothetical protein N7489_010147 [Penicillium chrysogenum]|uniref:Protein kinase domain-containing protein n=1 Tax=Penicillium chrysogenum TaxID=5076 RepID=A0ABQ8WUQ3_PENCH|nr:uncharacterized protein N7489_010147 [Penicillium chrysogenum]KAJ5229439.1 hypothetical protein N7489_010147 [Penicillium chrysogenum]KAJ5258844.1 hypothetical protein N7524_010400 [Penicillium chrysogenum]KAJ5282678.1 hypothetical protein N7505_000658 [Penicillium chrysogenum]KAJ6169315.1 hypothetical protein N7497_002158 [Penicillium chrysogenum]